MAEPSLQRPRVVPCIGQGEQAWRSMCGKHWKGMPACRPRRSKWLPQLLDVIGPPHAAAIPRGSAGVRLFVAPGGAALDAEQQLVTVMDCSVMCPLFLQVLLPASVTQKQRAGTIAVVSMRYVLLCRMRLHRPILFGTATLEGRSKRCRGC